MRYTSSLFAVRSIAKARAFYEEVLGQKVILDFGINITFEGGFCLQEDFAGLAGFPPERVRWNTYNAELYFESEEFDADVTRIKSAGVELLHEVKEYPWSQRVLRFFDPDGHLIELGESMRTVVLRFLDQGLSEEEAAQRSQHPIEFVRWCKASRKG